jgi:hypothetical protein
MARFDEDVKLGPAAKPVLVQMRPELGLVFLCGILDKEGDVAAQELELLAGRPAWRSHGGSRWGGLNGLKGKKFLSPSLYLNFYFISLLSIFIVKYSLAPSSG